MESNKSGIGQHRVIGRDAATNNGQRNVAGTPGDVGQPSGGERNNGPVPAGKPSGDISTQSMVERGRNDPARRR